MQTPNPERKPCPDPECEGKAHAETATCDKCGRCLYAHTKQIPDDLYPIFECACGERIFWD